MGTWIEKLEEKVKEMEEQIEELKKKRSVMALFDEVGIPAKGSVSRYSVSIEDADETIVPKIVAVKSGAITKHFGNSTGEVFYQTRIDGTTLYIWPDKAKYVCKVKRTETKVSKEETDVKFELEADCDPLLMEEG